MRYSVWVTFITYEKDTERFVELVGEQARNSLDLEPGCHIFDVWQSSNDPSRVLLYEIYEHQQAFVDHLNSAHYLAFDQEVQSMVVSKAVVTCDLELYAQS